MMRRISMAILGLAACTACLALVQGNAVVGIVFGIAGLAMLFAAQ